MSNPLPPIRRTVVADPGLPHASTVAGPGASTVAAEPATSAGTLSGTNAPRSTTMTSKGTVLPTFTGEGLVHHDRPRYEVTKSLGEGGMGQVALALDHDIGRPVAIKQLHPETSGDAASLARFVEEIRTVGSLEHPNIVPIHDVGVGEDGRYFFVMKHLEGETLESIIEKLAAGDRAAHAKYTFTARVEIMMGLLRALDYAHTQGIVHRDIKPANVMVGRYGEVVLMDWGVAKIMKPTGPVAPPPADGEGAAAPQDRRGRLFQTRHGSLVGTPAYMSPEQARGENASLDARSDLYSAAVVFQELLCLRHYLDDKQTLEDMLRGVAEEPLRRGQFMGKVPVEYLNFLHRAMQKKPEERFLSARQMIDRLEQTVDGTIFVECPFSFTKRTAREVGRFVDRHPILALMGLAGGAVGMLASVALGVHALLH
jgi:serine/threonine-protein kinase